MPSQYAMDAQCNSSKWEVSLRWWMTRRVERQATRMHEVMERLDVDAAALARVRLGQAYADA